MSRYIMLIVGGWLAGVSLLPAAESPPLAAEQIARLEACLAEAREQAAPVHLLRQRWEEGLAKNVDPELVVQAVQQRWQLLQQARALLVSGGYVLEAPPVVDLQATVTLALESGLSLETLTDLVGKGEGRYAGRLQGVVEAGESMFLAGLDESTVKNLMSDGLARNLRRVEMLRVARYATQQHRAGASGEQIRGSLWGDPSAWQGGGGGSGSGGRRRGWGSEAGSGVGGGAGQGPSSRGDGGSVGPAGAVHGQP